MKCCKLVISGKVQGVFFRKFTKQKADELGIKGFVRNQSDGSVYAEACGSEESLGRFIEWCRYGPQKALVENASVTNMEVKNFFSFEINYF